MSKLKENDAKLENIEIQEDEVDSKNIKKEEKKKKRIDTVSIEEIRDAIEVKINKEQKHKIIKNLIFNMSLAVIMVMYLVLLIMGTRNIEINMLQTDMKILAIGILAVGITGLEVAYKKDNNKLIINSVEVLMYGIVNLCLIYAVKLFFDSLVNIVIYVSIVILIYYIVKMIISLKVDKEKYKKENNDIKEIIKK